ncbi:MAG: ABC transporter substrate-binding protein [Thermodesulfobacteriota bacterium]
MKKRYGAVAVVLIAMVFVILSYSAQAGDRTAEVVTLLKTRTDAILAILEQTGLAETDKRKQIMDVVNPVINFPLMAKLSLGKENWARLSPEERDRFVDLFVTRLKNSYLDKTSLYSDLTITYEAATEEGDKVFVPTLLKTKNDVIKVVYRFYSAEGRWQVYDVEIEGVSFIKSYRSQFDEILAKGSVADLFVELNKKETPVPARPEAGGQSQAAGQQ